MSLDNLVGISLERIEPSPKIVKQLIDAALRNLADAKIPALSAETKFDAAYKAIMQTANAALQANGYRTLTSKPGHHQTMIQVLGYTVGIDKQTIILLDALRKQRNLADYCGDPIPEKIVIECLAAAEQLLQTVNKWIDIYLPGVLA